MSTPNNIAGKRIFVLHGKEVSQETFEQHKDDKQSPSVIRQNGPHHDSKWARRLLGTDISQTKFRQLRLGVA